jgi:predicted nuclease of predicted toxin-antitoxin system
MPGQIKFHLDENVSNAVAEGLRRRGVDVTTTPEQNLIGVSDQEQIAFAREQQRVIFTQDDDFLKLHQSKVSHSGIAYCHQGSRSIGEIVKTLALIWEWVEPEDMIRQVEFI